MFEYKATVLRVVDADTMDVSIDLGFKVFTRQRLRLARVDTPEVYGVKKESEEYQKGKAASAFAKKWVENADYEIIVKTEKSGKYGRYISEVYADAGPDKGSNLSDALLNNGHAVLYD